MSKNIFNQYIAELKTKKKKDKNNNWVLANPWATKKDTAFWEDCWNKLEIIGLIFDGKHITINENGLNFDYVAYKNKMLLAYPESKIDVELVYKGDTFSFDKTNGGLKYTHTFGNPFEHKDADIIGGYCVIKNKRGEFLTTLSKEEIEKARKVAKTQTIWAQWYSEMCKKTIIKKAVKFHFDDVYSVMEDEDNRNYDLENADVPEENILSEALKNAISQAKDITSLKAIYDREYNGLKTAALKAEFVSLCTLRKGELSK